MADHAVDDDTRAGLNPIGGQEYEPARREADIVRSTLRLWRPRTSRSLGRKDAHEIAENLVGFFRVLAEWDTNERSSDSADDKDAISDHTSTTASASE